MHIKEEHYDKIVKLLVEVLVELGVPMSIIGEIGEIAASVKYDICDLKLLNKT